MRRLQGWLKQWRSRSVGWMKRSEDEAYSVWPEEVELAQPQNKQQL
jgi:hypothetical protein